MILNDYDIRDLARKGMIDPFQDRLSQDGMISWGLSSFGYDVRLGTGFKKSELSCGFVTPFSPALNERFKPLDPLQPDGFEDVIHEGPFIIHPGQFILGHTVEYIHLPRDVSGMVMDKSTYARSGIHLQNTILEAGWHGQITLEIYNNLNRPVILRPGQGIAQIIFFQGEPCEVSYGDRGGKYQGQVGATLPRVKGGVK